MGIGTYNELSLHRQLKEAMAEDGDIIEHPLDGYFIDIVRPDGDKLRLIEIQTRNFSAIKNKLIVLSEDYEVTLVYPIAAAKVILHVCPETGEVIKTRKSPKKGIVLDVFKELSRVPGLIPRNNLTVEAVLIKVEEIRCDDGNGTWRRRGVSIKDRKLVEIYDRIRLKDANDYLNLLPDSLPHRFTNSDLAEHMKIKQRLAAMISYSLRTGGVINKVGKKGRQNLFELFHGF